MGLEEAAIRLVEAERVRSFVQTPTQGGGVALMRHALVRFCQHLQVNVHWYVTTPSPEVFSITKRKFHNVLQGVAPRTYPRVCVCCPACRACARCNGPS